MTHGALFNGIAGFPLAASWAGIDTTWTVEIDEWCNERSKNRFPNAIQYTDIRAAKHLPYVDIISGGFPCQPFSVAGKQLAQEDDRHLWPEMLRVIREVKPSYVIGENVTGIIGLALDEVLASLEAEGYTCETFIVPACAVNAPHRRDRVWIIAYSGYNESQGWHKLTEGQQYDGGGETWSKPSSSGSLRATSNPFNQGLQRDKQSFIPGTWRGQEGRAVAQLHKAPSWHEWPTQSPVCSDNDGLPTGLVRDRAKQLKAYGNAIVPQVAFEFFKAIIEIESAIRLQSAA